MKGLKKMGKVRKIKEHGKIKIIVDYFDITGKRHRERGFDSIKEANKRLNEVEYKKSKGINVQGSNSIKFKEIADNFIELYAKGDCKPSTINSYESMLRIHINPYFENIKINQIHPDIIQDFKNQKQDEISHKTINNILMLLSAIFEKAIDSGFMLTNPVRKIKKMPIQKNKMEILTLQEIKRLMEAANQTFPNFFPLLYTAMISGCRRGELLALQWQDIDFDNNCINVNKTLYKKQFQRPKTESSNASVFITPDLAKELLKWKDICPKGELNLVFPNTEGNQQNPDNMVRRHFNKCVEIAGIKKHVVFHSMRHLTASLMLSKNIPMKVIQMHLRHSQIATSIDRYSHLMDHVNKNAMESLDDIFSKDLAKMRRPVYKKKTLKDKKEKNVNKRN